MIDDPEELVENKKHRPITILIVIIIVLIVVIAFISRDMDQIRAFIAGSGYIGLLVAVGLYALLGASPIPSEPLTVLLSTIFGPLNATIAAGLGNLLAALIEYYLGAHLGHIADFAKRKESLPLGLGKLPITSPLFLMGARMMPGYGPKLVSVLSGVYRVPIFLYIWTTAIPTFLGAAIFAYGGFGIFKLRG